MDLQSVLAIDAVVSNIQPTSKKRLFKDIAELAKKKCGLDSDVLCSALVEREDLGSTSMGGGVAIPHARVKGLDKLFGAFLKLRSPIDYDEASGQDVDLVFAIFAPYETHSDHLKALARISRTLRNPIVQEQLRSTDEIDAIYTILTRDLGSVAA